MLSGFDCSKIRKTVTIGIFSKGSTNSNANFFGGEIVIVHVAIFAGWAVGLAQFGPDAARNRQIRVDLGCRDIQSIETVADLECCK